MTSKVSSDTYLHAHRGMYMHAHTHAEQSEVRIFFTEFLSLLNRGSDMGQL